MNIEIQDLPAMKVAYLHNVGNYVGNSELFGKLFTQLGNWAGPKGLFGPDTVFMSAYYDDPEKTNPDELRLDVCMTVPEGTEVEGDIHSQTLPGGKYAVYREEMKGPEDYKKAWQDFYKEWIPQSGEEVDMTRPFYEIYRSDPKQDPEGKHLVDICIPLN